VLYPLSYGDVRILYRETPFGGDQLSCELELIPRMSCKPASAPIQIPPTASVSSKARRTSAWSRCYISAIAASYLSQSHGMTHAQNAMVALESLGLGAVFIGALRNKPAEVAAELGLPPKCRCRVWVCHRSAAP
jgi:nitroreductase